MVKILLTGISGFIGSHILDHLLLNTDWNIIGVASWSHKGAPQRILDSKIYQKYKNRVEIITHDLTSPLHKFDIDKLKDVKYILNVASESHVDRSIAEPVSFIKNNVDLVLNMLELAREIKPEVFVQVSTDEVYGCAEGFNHKEWSPIIPSNPYAASKAAQEAIAISYWRTYGVPLIITNTMNNIGERQDSEKFIPLLIRKILNGEKVFIHAYSDRKKAGSRFYLHARNHADALLYILRYKLPLMYPDVDRPDRYNIVGEKEVNNLDMAQFVAKELGKNLSYKLVDFHSSRPGHDTRYGLDGNKLDRLGWKPPLDFETSLKRTIRWTLKNKKWIGG